MSATVIVVTGLWQNPDTSPATGDIVATPRKPATNAPDNYPAKTTQAFLVDGALALPLVANDDSGTTPTDGQWFVMVRVVGAPTLSGYVVVPSSPAGSRKVTDGVTAAGVAQLASATGAFGSGDIGKYLWTPDGTFPVGTQIETVVNSTTVTTTQPATETATGQTVLVGAQVDLVSLLS